MVTPRRRRREDDPQATEPPHETQRNIAPSLDATTRASEDAIDMAIEMTFPASDPPAWTTARRASSNNSPRGRST
jgi:hypothetical protein